MIILPTKNRPQNMKRFIEAYYNTFATAPVTVVYEESDYASHDLELPAHWWRALVPDGTRIGDIFNGQFQNNPNEAVYGIMADDVFPITPYWDAILSHYAGTKNIAWGKDTIQNEKLPTHPFIGGELVRKLGWLAAPGIKHWYVDNVWKALATELNCGIYLDNIRISHLHPTNARAKMDGTYSGQPSPAQDLVRFREFMHNEFADVIRRVRNAEKAKTNAG